MKKAITIAILALLAISTLVGLASAIVIKSVDTENLIPGEDAKIKITVENNLDEDIEDVSLVLNLAGLPFSSIGSTEDNINEILSDEDEDFGFIIKADNDAGVGDYNIPYSLTYSGLSTAKTGTIGITVSGNSKLTYSVDREDPIVGSQGKITFKIVNKGLADARFVSIKVLPSGFTLLSEGDVYIGTVNSDDFESETFDVVFNTINPTFSAVITYTEFDNTEVEENINLPVTVYTREKALELGIIKKSNAPIYFGIVAGFFVIWFIWRKISKARARKRAEGR